MLEKIRELIVTFKNEDNFFNRLKLYFPDGGKDLKRIKQAYTETMRDFHNILRDGGTPYFGHPEAVAIIGLEYLRIRDPDFIVSAILHDNVEDLAHLGWTFDRIADTYGNATSELVWWVTKPHVDEFGGHKEERDRAYHVRLSNAPRAAILLKLSDRLHNIMTLWAQNEEKQRRKIYETRTVYLSLAEKHCVFIHELEHAMSEVEKKWTLAPLSV